MSKSVQKALSLAVVAETTQFSRDMARLKQIIKATNDPVKKLNEDMKLLGKAASEGAIKGEQYALALRKIHVDADKASDRLKKLAKDFDALKASSSFYNRRAGLKVQADIQKERDSVDAHREAMEKRLAVFKRENAERQKLANQRKLGVIDGLRSQEREDLERMERRAAQIAARREAREAASNQRKLDAIERVRTQEQENLERMERRAAQIAARREAREAASNQRKLDAIDRVRTQEEQALADLENKAARLAARRQARADNRQRGLDYMTQFDTPRMAMQRQMNEAFGMKKSGAINAQEYAHAVTQIRRQNSLLHQSFAQVRGVMLTLVGPLVATITAWETLKKAVTLSAELEAARAKFEVFMGSAEKANKLLADLRQLSTQSPVSFTGGQKAATTMIHYGVDPNSLADITKRMAMITGGNADRMDKLALAYAQVSGASRLMGQELLQMVNAGFNPLKIISEQTGENMRELKKRMEEGGVSFEEVANAFKVATDEGGRFDGVLEKVANTTYGKMIKLTNEWEKALTKVGGALEPMTNFTLENLTNRLKMLSFVIDQMNGGGSGGGSAVDDSRQGLGSWITDINAMLNLGGSLTDVMQLPANATFQDKFKAMEAVDKSMPVESGITTWLDNNRSTMEAIKSQNDWRSGDSSKWTDAQKEADRILTQQSGTKVSRKEYERLRKEYDQQMRLEKDAGERHKLTHGFFDSQVGRDYATGFDRKRLAEADAYMESERDQKRVDGAFGSLLDTNRLIDKTYGDKSSLVRALFGQSAGEERKELEELIQMGSSYEEIFIHANEKAQQSALAAEKMLDAEKKLNTEYKDRIAEMDAELAYKRDLVLLTEKEAMIRKYMREGRTAEEAAELYKREQFLRQFDEKAARDGSSSSAPAAMQQGSREAYAAIANRQAAMVSEQVKLQREALMELRKQTVANQATVDVLKNSVTVGPM